MNAIQLPRLDTGPFLFNRPPALTPEAARRPARAVNLLDWTARHRRWLGPDRPFDLTHHPYLEAIYRTQWRQALLMKAAQMGASEWLISYALHACDRRNATALYVFPTDSHVSDFSAARLGPAIEASPYLASIIVDGRPQDGKRGSDRVTLKRVHNRFLYFRGAQVKPDGSAAQLKSIDADVLILDELDEMDPRAPSIAAKRLGHSAIGETRMVSTPRYPGSGIHAGWLESDQRLWHVACPHCGERQPLAIEQVVTEWDDLGRPVAWHGKDAPEGHPRAWAACVKCGQEVDRLGQGEWVATYPDREVVGFHLSKLFSAQTPLIEIVRALDTADETKRREAFNQDLGLPYRPRGGGLDAGVLDACRGDYAHGPQPGVVCYMGVDVGKVLHVVVRSGPDAQTGKRRQLYAGETSWNGLADLLRRFSPRVVVMDALPETTKGREFQAQQPRGRVWLAYYTTQAVGSKRESFAAWDWKALKADLDRTRALDETLARFADGSNSLPAHAREIRDYYAHLTASVRVVEKDARGQEVARYVETGPDHYAHAECYCVAASECPASAGWVRGASN